MVKFIIESESEGGDTLCVGITAENLARLKKGNPMLLDVDYFRKSIGSDFEVGNVMIFQGESEEDVIEKIENTLDESPEMKRVL